MKRQVTMEEISDGKLYTSNDAGEQERLLRLCLQERLN